MIQVVIPSYRYGHLISHAIESVLSQTKKADRILVVDDGAKDVAQDYPVDYLIREKNYGIVDNFNDILYNHVTCDKVIFLGADNWLHPQALEKMDNGADITSCDITLWGTEVETFREGLPTFYENGYWIWTPGIHGSALYNAELARKMGGYRRNPDSIKSEEDKMLFEAMIAGGANYTYIQEPLLYYRRHIKNYQK